MKQSPGIIAACSLGIVLILLGMIVGAWRPYRKSQIFIRAERSQIRTIDEFKETFDRAFDYYSPVGDEELIKFLAGNMLSIVPQQEEAVARELVAYIEPKLFKDEVRHLMMAGQFRQNLYQLYGEESDYQAAVGYFQAAHEIGPDLPTPTYSLFGMYQLRGDADNMERMAREILARWPNDEKISALFEE